MTSSRLRQDTAKAIFAQLQRLSKSAITALTEGRSVISFKISASFFRVIFGCETGIQFDRYIDMHFFLKIR